jgi:hypothetical protein
MLKEVNLTLQQANVRTLFCLRLAGQKVKPSLQVQECFEQRNCILSFVNN